MRPTRRLTAGVAGLACSVALLAGCGGDDNEPSAGPTETGSSEPTIESPGSTESTEPTETSTPPTERERAVAEAEQAVRDYYGFADEVRSDPEVADLMRLDNFLQDPELTNERTYLEGFRDQGFQSEGATTFDWMRATKVELFPGKDQAAVSLEVCYNLDEVVTRNKAGDVVDLISPGLATYEVYTYSYPQGGWKIAVENVAGKRCKS